ncbi:MAG: 2-hydroxyacid dehydrogenase [Beijerinckiaceae bacterium]
MPEKIVLLDLTTEERAEKIRQYLPAGMIFSHGTARGDAHMKDIIADADYAISGQVGVNAEVLGAAKKLKLLHKWGVGVDNIDIDAARRLGIRVARTTGGNAVPVAEFTIGLILSTLRNIAYGHAELQKGEWRGGRLPRENYMLSGKTVGIIGFGAIGQTLSRLLTGFGCTILYHNRTPLAADKEMSLNASYASLPDILARSDVVSLNCPLTQETRGLINRSALEQMKPTAILVNVARGGVVVEDDLIWALNNRRILAAAMDVFETEPLPADSPLLRTEHLVVTPHLAAIAADNFAPMLTQMFDNMMRVSKGLAVPDKDSVV